MNTKSSVGGLSPIKSAVVVCRRSFVAIGVFTAEINILMLTGSFFMLQVYDRVIPSRSIPTLVGLIILVSMLYGFQGILDFIRQRLVAGMQGLADLRSEAIAGSTDAETQAMLIAAMSDVCDLPTTDRTAMIRRLNPSKLR